MTGIGNIPKRDPLVKTRNGGLPKLKKEKTVVRRKRSESVRKKKTGGVQRITAYRT